MHMPLEPVLFCRFHVMTKNNLKAIQWIKLRNCDAIGDK